MLARRINRVRVTNYRSLGNVDITLNDLTVLVGPNSSGKSNFVDVLRFVRDALQVNLNTALQKHYRGEPSNVIRYSRSGEFKDITIRLDFTIGDAVGEYAFTLTVNEDDEFHVTREHCKVGEHSFDVDSGRMVISTSLHSFPTDTQQLALRGLIHTDTFSPVFGYLVSMSFYNITPDSLRQLRRSGYPYPLQEDGSNLASALEKMTRKEADSPRQEMIEHLAAVIPDLNLDDPISVDDVGRYLIPLLRHADGSRFDLTFESDGTLRALGILTALSQRPPRPLIGIEEPELMLHPKAVSTLTDIIKAVSTRTQIILTTHSPDLINLVDADDLRLVERIDGVTRIDPVSESDRQIIEEKLFGGGDLLRMGALRRD